MKPSVRFIVIDDEAISNTLCKLVISRATGEEAISTFQEPEAALKAISEAPAATDTLSTILFLDLNMPTMTGWEFLDVYKSFDKAIHDRYRVYILTSSVDDRDKAKAGSNPLVQGIFSKPLTIVNVRDIVNNQC
jgi:CheY-like chemotaxis protein